MNELKIIANVTAMGLVISVILLPIFHPNVLFIELTEILDAIILGLMAGSFFYLLKEAIS